MTTESVRATNPQVHAEKKGLRVFGIAESFMKSEKKSILAGVVMRRDLIVDGLAFGKATVEGDDATENIISMYKSLRRQDINCILVGGLVISMYNIVDGEKISKDTGLPTIGVTFEESEGLENSIKHHFHDSWELKLERYSRLGTRDRVTLKTGKTLFIRYWGIMPKTAISLLNSFTLQGAIPEPIRIAKLAARAHSVAVHQK